jgi:hypothetical protein
MAAVRRAYFFDVDDPEPDLSEDIERWCASCRATYPHLELDAPN